MKSITNAEYEEYQKYKRQKLRGHILTPDGLRFIVESYDGDAEKIGNHFLELLPKIMEMDGADEKSVL